MKKKDPVKEFQKQTEAQLRNKLEEFKDECVHNIGINALIERYEY